MVAMAKSEVLQLRPLEEADLGTLGRFDTEPSLSQPFEWAGFRDPRARRRRWEQDGYLGEDHSILTVAIPDGSFVGYVTWWPTRTFGPRGGCFDVGIILLPEHRGKGLGAAAQVILADYLFATTLANRLQAITDVENVAEHRALKRAGFQREGVMRSVSFVGGQWRDGALYARLRHDSNPLSR